jgi:riboflavin kinase / FMN adenylyltransferase
MRDCPKFKRFARGICEVENKIRTLYEFILTLRIILSIYVPMIHSPPSSLFWPRISQAALLRALYTFVLAAVWPGLVGFLKNNIKPFHFLTNASFFIELTGNLRRIVLAERRRHAISAPVIQRLHGNSRTADPFRGGIVALGNFDGFHAGHQAVAGRAIALAKERDVPALVATFDPHPVRHFKPDTPPFRLTTLDQRERLFGAAGADAMVVFEFGPVLSQVTADDFIADWLIGHLGASGVVTGEDFTFGKGRGGTVAVLAEQGRALGLTCEAVSPVSDGDIISSSRIRDALQSGDCETATQLLTRPFTVEGVVQHGDKVGRTLGFPTANLDMGQYLRPRYGVYAVKGRLPDGRVLNGAANLGIRPQFDPPKELLEPYFFDFAEDLYGQRIEVEFHHFLRGEAKFYSLDALMVQMKADCDRARALLK